MGEKGGKNVRRKQTTPKASELSLPCFVQPCVLGPWWRPALLCLVSGSVRAGLAANAYKAAGPGRKNHIKKPADTIPATSQMTSKATAGLSEIMLSSPRQQHNHNHLKSSLKPGPVRGRPA